MSLRQSMYTGLAQPEVKMNGLSEKKSTALTSSSILAVVSATKALSAKCISGADSTGRMALIRAHGRVAMRTKTTVFAAAALMLAPLAADAQTNKEQYTYRCVGKDGKKYYGQTIPEACLGRPLELINKQGLVVKRIDLEGEEKARIAKEAEAEKKREAELAEKDNVRRTRALLATYTSEKDIEDSRNRDLRNHDKGVQEVQKRIDDIKKRQQQFQKELALFNEAGKGSPPA